MIRGVTSPPLGQLVRRLGRPADGGRFSAAETDDLPPAVRRFFRSAIAVGTPLAMSARLRMRGRIKVGRWLPFRAREFLTPHDGFVWWGSAAGIIVGSDRYVEGVGVADWKLGGLFTVMHAEGPDASRSAAGRGGAEGVWLPTALLPRFGVVWSAHADDLISASYRVGSTPLVVQYRLDEHGRVRSFVFDRWGDPDDSGAWNWHPFGGEATAYRTFDGVTIPSAGRVGWFYGTRRWDDGEFFRYEITDLHPITHTPAATHDLPPPNGVVRP